MCLLDFKGAEADLDWELSAILAQGIKFRACAHGADTRIGEEARTVAQMPLPETLWNHLNSCPKSSSRAYGPTRDAQAAERTCGAAARFSRRTSGVYIKLACVYEQGAAADYLNLVQSMPYFRAL